MTIFETISLPNQPVTGSAIFQPMGGDGWTAPLGRYEVDASLTMDASGGTWSIGVELDRQFMNLVALMQLEMNISSDTEAFSMDIKMRAATNIYRVAGDLLQTQTTSINRIWSPPPIIDPVNMDFRLGNTDTKIGRATGTVYCFRKGAQHEVPIDKLLQCLVRAGSVN